MGGLGSGGGGARRGERGGLGEGATGTTTRSDTISSHFGGAKL